MTAAPTGVRRAQSDDERLQLQRRWPFGRMAEPHRHPHVEVNLVVEGTASYVLDNARYELRPQSVVWLFPGQDHLLTDCSDAYSDWLGLFDPAAMHHVDPGSNAQTLLEADPQGFFVRQLTVAEADRLHWLFTEVTSAVESSTRNAGLEYAMLAAWEAFRRSDRVPPTSPVHPAVAHVARILSSGEATTSVDALARDVGLTPGHLGKIFRTQIGTSITRFRNQQRLRHFLDMYRNAAVAERVRLEDGLLGLDQVFPLGEELVVGVHDAAAHRARSQVGKGRAPVELG